jgi:proteasome lid subunit RPN8/RPN11
MSSLTVPPTLRHLNVPRHVLEETWALLREPGEQGLEGTVLWPGRVLDATTGEVLAAYRPTQVAYRSEHGVAVEIPQEALTDLIAALPDGVHLLARVHTHPGKAYHSRVDDGNMVIGHIGAVSVVVPDFAAGPPSLDGCSVNRLGADGRWVELDPVHARDCLRLR